MLSVAHKPIMLSVVMLNVVCSECRGALNNFKVLGFTPNPTPAPSHLQQKKQS